MDGAKTFELKVGVFILIGIAVLFIIVFSIGDIKLVKGGYHIKVIFNFASGIGPSAPVRLAGVGCGQVERLHLFYDEKEARTKVEVYSWIESNDIKIEKDAVATINTLGLLGEKYLEIIPGAAEKGFLKDSDTLIGKDPVAMEKITENLANLSESVGTVVDRLKKGEGTIGKLLVEDKIYRDLEAFVGDIKKHPWKLLSKPRGE